MPGKVPSRPDKKKKGKSIKEKRAAKQQRAAGSKSQLAPPRPPSPA